MAFLFDGRISQDHARGRDIDFEMTSPEYSVVSAHIAEINSRIPTADHDISSYANDLLKAGLIGSAGYDSAIGSARKLNPQYKIASLTSKAMDKIKTSPHLFSSLVTIVEKRDREFASILREEYGKCWSRLARLTLIFAHYLVCSESTSRSNCKWQQQRTWRGGWR